MERREMVDQYRISRKINLNDFVKFSFTHVHERYREKFKEKAEDNDHAIYISLDKKTTIVNGWLFPLKLCYTMSFTNYSTYNEDTMKLEKISEHVFNQMSDKSRVITRTDTVYSCTGPPMDLFVTMFDYHLPVSELKRIGVTQKSEVDYDHCVFLEQ
jgi:hypothetical protein